MPEPELDEVVGDVPAIPAEEPASPEADASEEAPLETSAVDDPPDPATLKAEVEELESQKKQAKERALYWRQQKAKERREYFNKPEPATPPAEAEKPRPDQANFDDYNDYVDALTDWKVDQKTAAWDREQEQRAQNQTHQTKMQALRKKIDAGYEKYDDFEDVALAETVPITPMVQEVLAETENPADVAYYLGKNQTEAIKIARMTPIAAARAIAKIEAEISANPATVTTTKKTTTGAPPPITPIGGATAAVSKDMDKMTQAEFEAEMERRGAPRY